MRTLYRRELAELKSNIDVDVVFEFDRNENLPGSEEHLFITIDGDDKVFDAYDIVHWPDTIIFSGRDGGRIVISFVEYVDIDIMDDCTKLIFHCGAGGKVIRKYTVIARKLNQKYL